MALSIASITTAYNAVHRLPAQLDALLGQSRPLQEIIVIDNESTDGTVAMLAERYPQVTVIPLPTNVGAAGGSAAGLTYAALERKHDWVWNLDDDSIPDQYALETLLAGAGDLVGDPSVGMLVPLPVHAASGTPYPPRLWRDGYVLPTEEMLREEVWFADLVIASGCMVRYEAVEKCGVPRVDFFMDFSDYEYSLRLRSHGYKIAVVNGCKFSHEIGEAKTFNILGFRHTWSEHVPWREYYISRNMTYSIWWLYPTFKAKLFLIKILFRHLCAILLFGSEKFLPLKMLLQGFLDGRRGRLGIRFLPQRVNSSKQL